jgi:excisionase family DNA binding protein
LTDNEDSAAPQQPQLSSTVVVKVVFMCDTVFVMRGNAVILASQGDELLTTGEAALILNSSRQHVVDLCDQGLLPFVTTGTHRRVRRADVDALRSRTERLTRDQGRSLWLGYAIAGKLVADPLGVLEKGRANLSALESHRAARRWLAEWEKLLDGPLDGVLEGLTSRAPRARELRQNSPFAGVLTEEERQQVLAGFIASRQKSRS